MKHEGKAARAALRLIFISLAAVLVLLVTALLAKFLAAFILALSSFLLGLWVLFVLFTFYFFRDPEPGVPAGPGLVVAPGHGKIDFVGTGTESMFMGGECQRISIFLSVFDVHVQNAPVTGRVALCQHTPGQFINAMRVDSAEHNENVLIGIEGADPRGEKIALRLIAGLIARRIIPWINTGETVARGERISLIQFGSRVDVYLPARAKIKVKPGDRAVGGETILAAFE
jgi:phosphatidylserine decarboxylase